MKMITLEEDATGKMLPIIKCDKCGSSLSCGNCLVIWNNEFDVKFVCKGNDCENKFENYEFSDTIESFMFKLVYNSKLGRVKRTKRKWS